MRIAITGSHRVGKTTLAEALAEALPGHDLIPEPYVLLEEEGHLFPGMPALDDFERQLERSLQCLEESGPDTVFDRCPLDILAYLVTHQEAAAFRMDDWLPRIQQAMATMDRIVYVPIESPDRVPVPRSEARLRRDVDQALQDMLLEDEVRAGVDVITVKGSAEDRFQAVLSLINRRVNRPSGVGGSEGNPIPDPA